MLVKIGEVWVDPDHVVAIERESVVEQATGGTWSVLHLSTGARLMVPLSHESAARAVNYPPARGSFRPGFEGDDGR